MSKNRRNLLVAICIVGFLIWGIVWPLITIFMSLRSGSEIQEALLATLKEKYPDHTFQKRGVGYGSTPGIPSVRIGVLSKPNDEVKKDMLSFLASEVAQRKLVVSLSIEFEKDNKKFILRKSKNLIFEWEEEEW